MWSPIESPSKISLSSCASRRVPNVGGVRGSGGDALHPADSFPKCGANHSRHWRRLDADVEFDGRVLVHSVRRLERSPGNERQPKYWGSRGDYVIFVDLYR